MRHLLIIIENCVFPLHPCSESSLVPIIQSNLRFDELIKNIRNFLSKLILQGKKEKIFKKEIDSDLTALVIIAFHVGILLQWSMNKDEIDGEAYVNTFKKIMLEGLMV